MEELFEITFSDMYLKRKEADEEFFCLVKGTEEEVKEICKKMSEYRDTNVWQGYSYKKVKLNVMQAGEGYYKVESYTNNKGFYSNFKHEMYVQESEEGMKAKVDYINERTPDNTLLAYKKIDILSPNDALNLYNKRLSAYKNMNLEENIL